jgi:crotonobetainyl-CoA:carnitine CoA-transferase CaiB-like acyl-CoA transferase
MTATMNGVRVLEVAEHTFVPAASAILADWGADVIKIEHVERGDAMRGLGSTGVMDLGDSRVHALWEHSNRGKRSLGLNLATPDGVDILYRLATTADVFLTNKMPSVRERLGIDVDDIRHHNSEIIYVRGSGFGARGPDADAGGYDSLAFWARSGAAVGSKPHEVDHIPMMPAPAFGDSMGAMTIAGGIAAALFHRASTGEATLVDVSLYGTGLWAMGAAVALSAQTGQPWVQPPGNSRQFTKNALAGTYRTSDDRWIAFTCLQGYRYWDAARETLGLEHLRDDDRFASAEAFARNSPELASLIAEVMVKHTQAEWMTRLHGFSGQWAPVLDSLEVIQDPQASANGYVLEARSIDDEPFPLVTTPVQFNEEPRAPHRGPAFNEHGDEILQADLGLDWETIVDLKVRGVVA